MQEVAVWLRHFTFMRIISNYPIKLANCLGPQKASMYCATSGLYNQKLHIIAKFWTAICFLLPKRFPFYIGGIWWILLACLKNVFLFNRNISIFLVIFFLLLYFVSSNPLNTLWLRGHHLLCEPIQLAC